MRYHERDEVYHQLRRLDPIPVQSRCPLCIARRNARREASPKLPLLLGLLLLASSPRTLTEYPYNIFTGAEVGEQSSPGVML
ncbi:hypothetical protein E2C01_031639 [Portunus trituberculatus]|uniref:Uncharacterized protein n=1 Tax=Portunus trituberculatus TaxID=210409 RepID=A0A5B7EY48_PORTR|nr:hypothetical protein [Portunus trituberculatus]